MSKRLAVIAVSLLLASSAWAQKNKMNLYIWSEYIDPEIVTNFEKQYDCKVTVDLYEDNESMVAKLQGGGTSLYDVERELIRQALEQSRGNKTTAAKLLRITRDTLRYKVKKYGL